MRKDTIKSILGAILIAVISSLVTVKASGYLYESKDVKYDNDPAKIKAGNVQDAIDELYTHSRDFNELDVRLTSLENTYLDKTYPVGSIYISVTDSTVEQVQERFGGTWEAFGQGRTLIGVGTGKDTNSTSKTFTVNTTGGEYNHTLSISEMPAHTHTRGTMEITGQALLGTSHSSYETVVSASGAFSTRTEFIASDGNSQARDYLTEESTGSRTYRDDITMKASNSWTGSTSSVGGSQSHNNIQPYITVYMWKRTG